MNLFLLRERLSLGSCSLPTEGCHGKSTIRTFDNEQRSTIGTDLLLVSLVSSESANSHHGRLLVPLRYAVASSAGFSES